MEKLSKDQKFQLKKMLKNWDKIEPNITDGRGTMYRAIGDVYVFQTANGKKHGVFCDKETFEVFRSKL
jgi:hypothetical protein